MAASASGHDVSLHGGPSWPELLQVDLCRPLAAKDAGNGALKLLGDLALNFTKCLQDF